jgi:hypothetical protein
MGTKVWLSLMGLSLTLLAQEPAGSWRLSGFGTIGLATSSTDRVEYTRDRTQPQGVTNDLNAKLDSRLGVQGNLNLRDDLELVGQVVSTYRYDGTYSPDLTWAFISYAPTSGLQIRAGRLGWDVFQLADTKNVGYSYLWARPPVDFFGTLAISRLDGADASWTFPIAKGQNLKFKVSAGQSSEKTAFNGPSTSLDMSGGKLFGSVAEYQGESLNLRLAYARVRTGHEFPSPLPELRDGLNAFANVLSDPGLAQEADGLVFKDRTLEYYSVGLGWSKGHLQVDASGAQARSGTRLFPGFKAGYLSVGYREGSLVPYILVSRIVSDTEGLYLGALPSMGPQGEALAAGLTGLNSRSVANQTTLALGLRWDFHPKAALKVQVDHVIARPDATLLFTAVQPGWDGRVTVASVLLDFVF